jgi:anti-anti-sigma factor
MDAARGTIRYSRRGRVMTFHVTDHATMTSCLVLRERAEQALAAGAPDLHFDLRRCTHLDSTFIGTLLFLKRAAGRAGGELVLVSPSPRCWQVLEQMGLTGVLPAASAEEPDTASWAELGADLEDAGACKRNIVEAHRELAALPGPAGEAFRSVMRCLADEPEARRAGGG